VDFPPLDDGANEMSVRFSMFSSAELSSSLTGEAAGSQEAFSFPSLGPGAFTSRGADSPLGAQSEEASRSAKTSAQPALDAAALAAKAKQYAAHREFAKVVALQGEVLRLVAPGGQAKSNTWCNATSEVLETLSDAHGRMCMWAQSVDFQKHRLQAAQGKGDSCEEARSHGWLGRAYMRLKQHDQALSAYQKQLKLLDSSPQSEHCRTLEAMSGVGQCLNLLGHTEEAVSMHKKQLERAEKEGSVQERINALMDLSASQPLLDAHQSLSDAFALIEGGDFKEIDEWVLSHAYFRLGVFRSNILQMGMYQEHLASKNAGCTQNKGSAFEKKDCLFAALYAFRRAIELDNIQGATMQDSRWRESCMCASGITPQGLLLTARLLYMQVFLSVSSKVWRLFFIAFGSGIYSSVVSFCFDR